MRLDQARKAILDHELDVGHSAIVVGASPVPVATGARQCNDTHLAARLIL